MSVTRLQHITKIGVEDMGDLADAASRDSAAILRLENLDTDLRPPAAAIEATLRSISDDDANSYLPFLGLDRTRQAAANLVGRLSGARYDWKTECIITAGGLSGILNALLAVLEPGDEVLMTDPIYVGLINRVRLAGGVPVFAPLDPSSGEWRLDLDALHRMDTSKVKAVLTMSPSMPTGATFTRDEWDAIANVCRANDCWLIYDTAMERILYDGYKHIHPASLPGMRERTITVGSVSKEYRMIGWRVGWVVGPSAIVPDISRVSISNVVCQVGIGMPGAAAAIDAADDGIAVSVAEWQRRRDVILEELTGLPVIKPNGGWSLLLDVRQLGFSSRDASKALLTQGEIAATAMVNWGTSRTDDYIRFVFANEPVERLRGLRARMAKALRL
jgi:aspartate/methionine/tyrosine aminotransferase